MAPARGRSRPKQQVRSAAASHIGASAKRSLLEDRSRAETIRTAGGLLLSLAVVADGIGGENAGERAAELTVTTIFDHFQNSQEINLPRLLQAALKEANQQVHSESKKSRRKTNMGSTAAIAAIADGKLYIANAGDSRVYLLRGQKAFPLTVDHTWENEVVQSGKLSRLEASKHPRKGQIVRSVGYEPELSVDLGLWLRGGQETAAEARAAQGLPLKPGDVILVCSDGLIKSRHDRAVAHYVEASEFAPLVRGRSAKGAVDELIKRALSRQVDDNVSAAILEIPGGTYLRRYVAPGAGVAAALGLMAVAAVWAAPRLSGSLGGPAAQPTIPALPSGVAFVSEIGGRGESAGPGRPFEPLNAEQLVSAGAGVKLKAVGSASYIRLGLADQSIVYLGPDSQVELFQIGGQGGTQLVLESGVVLVSAEGAGGQVTSISAPSGAQARMSGSLMGVRWDPIASQFEVDCFGGECEIVFPGVAGMRLAAGEHLAVTLGGEIQGPSPIAYQHYTFAGFVGGLVAAPTSIGAGAIAAGTTATRTPLGPLFVTPTPPPPPPPTRTPQPPPGPPPPEPTDIPPPTNTPAPPATPVPTTEPPEPTTEPPTADPTP
jgi:protein phosphatase